MTSFASLPHAPPLWRRGPPERCLLCLRRRLRLRRRASSGVLRGCVGPATHCAAFSVPVVRSDRGGEACVQQTSPHGGGGCDAPPAPRTGTPWPRRDTVRRPRRRERTPTPTRVHSRPRRVHLWCGLRRPDTFAVRLLAAVRESDLPGLTSLLADPQTGAVAWDRPCKYGTALHLAAYMGQRAVAEFLLQHGADVNARNDDGQAPPAHAANRALQI